MCSERRDLRQRSASPAQQHGVSLRPRSICVARPACNAPEHTVVRFAARLQPPTKEINTFAPGADFLDSPRFEPPCRKERVVAWLLDLQALSASTAGMREAVAVLDSAIGAALSSPEIRIVGFGLQHDFSKLALLSEWRSLSSASRVVDLLDACEASATKGQPHVSLGLSAQLRRWTGKSLDKSMQCSDWARRPLSAAQVRYAAADVVCLFQLLEASRESGAPRLGCVEVGNGGGSAGRLRCRARLKDAAAA